MAKFRKKPVVIEAFQLTEQTRWDNRDWPTWMNKAWNKEHGEGALWPDPDVPPNPNQESADQLVCGTSEGVLIISMGDYIIRGINGDIYTCKPDIFEATYEPVPE